MFKTSGVIAFVRDVSGETPQKLPIRGPSLARPYLVLDGPGVSPGGSWAHPGDILHPWLDRDGPGGSGMLREYTVAAPGCPGVVLE